MTRAQIVCFIFGLLFVFTSGSLAEEKRRFPAFMSALMAVVLLWAAISH